MPSISWSSFRAPRLPRRGSVRDLLDRLEPLRVRVRAEAVLPQPHEHPPLRLREIAVADAEAVHPERERPLGGDPRVELAERACGRVPRVRRGLLARGDLRLGEAREAGQREVDLAPNLEQRRRRLAVGGEDRERHGVDRAEVAGHVLASVAVSTRRPAHEPAVLVDERDRRPRRTSARSRTPPARQCRAACARPRPTSRAPLRS